MEFKNLKLTNSHVCDCMSGAINTNSEMFIRRIGAKKVKAGDFKVKIEREDTVDGDTCDEFCSQREISINNIERYDKDEIIESYKIELMKQKKYAPNIEFFYSEFCFSDGSGRVKHTPQHGHESHHDFYKSDTFDISMLQINGDPVRVAFVNTLVQEPSK
ncbi:hypothetical protein [Hymenobacter cellulosivorans]|uniref:Uncharacterized protein n=1 Tax=Hymenobacter cellulosivorans TaxID=2932249 RepID=A0ABY4FAQ9_9BACT|nr:hypothetical protein [Hymenobacter cellulosivorans]UOQ53525.1 hypothetical protein MUN80_01915 [Hymenobacter cellulosivorans]